jgi:hypothetical protein
MFGAEQDFSYLLADSGIAGIAKAARRHALFLQPARQELCLGAFAAAIRAVEHHELALEFILQRLLTFNNE